MTDRDEVSLSPSEAEAFCALPREAVLPDGLEEAIVARLRLEGLIRARHNAAFLIRIAAGVAAGAILFLLGSVWGPRAPFPGPPSGSRFVLFLYEGVGFDSGAGDRSRDRASEYRSWAVRLRRQGISITGAELKPEEKFIAPNGSGRAPEPAAAIAGYFVFGAKDGREALKIARSCPHLVHGGELVLREIRQ